MADLVVRVIPPSVARHVVTSFHYSRSWPTGNFLNFGAFLDGKLCGVVTFGHPASKDNWKSAGCIKPRGLAELTRLWIADWAPPFCESRAIAACLRILRRDSICEVVVSYADPMQAHVGTVYQASNWIYVGQQVPTGQFMFSDGSLMHKRAAYDRFGTNRPDKLRSVDPNIRVVRVPGKYKYLYAVDRAAQPRLQVMKQPYPKRAGPERGGGDQPPTGGADLTPALHLGVDHG